MVGLGYREVPRVPQDYPATVGGGGRARLKPQKECLPLHSVNPRCLLSVSSSDGSQARPLKNPTPQLRPITSLCLRSFCLESHPPYLGLYPFSFLSGTGTQLNACMVISWDSQSMETPSSKVKQGSQIPSDLVLYEVRDKNLGSWPTNLVIVILLFLFAPSRWSRDGAFCV